MPSWSRPAVVVAVVVLALAAVAVGAVRWVRPDDQPDDRPARAAQPRATSTPVPQRQVARATTLQRKPPPACEDVRHGFAPRTISVAGVTTGAGVVEPPRDANDIPGTPPLTSAGKLLFAWDTAQGISPGDRHGNVLLNAHTWPDGTALGNRMLARVQDGSRIVVRGEGNRLCYRVTEEVEVLAADGLPRYYDEDGPPQLAILVCSGRRLGPGVWTHRTVWFASPVKVRS